MSKLWCRLLTALVIIALLILIFCVLFRVFVTNRIMDGGCGMENPDLRRAEAKLPASDAEELSLREDINNSKILKEETL